MTFRGYLLSMVGATVICWLGVASILTFVDPFDAGLSGIILFYASVFLGLVGALALGGIVLRMWLFPKESRYTQVLIAFRQSILFAMLIDGALFLSHHALLTWWTLLLFIALLTVLEFLFISMFSAKAIEIEK